MRAICVVYAIAYTSDLQKHGAFFFSYKIHGFSCFMGPVTDACRDVAIFIKKMVLKQTFVMILIRHCLNNLYGVKSQLTVKRSCLLGLCTSHLIVKQGTKKC